MKTKRYYAERVLLELQNDHRNIDFKIDEREVFLVLDDVVNDLAAKNYFETWKTTGAGIDEQFITTWEPIEVTDQPDGLPSFLTLPSNYAALPRNRGIDEVYPMRYNTKNQSSVVIMSHNDFRLYKNNPACGMQGRLFGYVQSNKIIFGSCDVGKTYGKEFGVRLVVRDSSQIGENDLYPIPSDKENFVVATAVDWFRSRRAQPTDSVRDNKDQE